MSVEGTTRRVGRPASSEGIRKVAILEMALSAFATSGFEGTTMLSIAKGAGVKDSLLHYHFGSKENLWQEAVAMATGHYIKDAKKTERYFKDLELESLTKALIRQMVYSSAEYIDLYKIIYHEMMHKSTRTQFLIDHVIAPYAERHRRLFQRYAEEKGVTINWLVGRFVTVSYGLYATYFILAPAVEQIDGVEVFSEDQIERHADVVTDLIYQAVFAAST